MNRTIKDKITFVVSAIIALVVIGGSVYFYLYLIGKQRTDDELMLSVKNSLQETSPQSKLETSLLTAEANLQSQTNRLVSLQSELGKQQYFAVAMKKGYEKAGIAIEKTDVLFDDVETSSPKIKIPTKTNKIQSEINIKRKQVTEALNSWREEIAKAQDAGMSAAGRAQIENDTTVIQSYLAALQSIVESLSPDNSNLTQAQIDSYKNLVQESVELVDAVIATAPIITYPGTSGDTGSSNTNISIPPTSVVTVQDVAVQQNVVDQAQSQVNELQEVLDQIQASTTPETASSPVQDQSTTIYTYTDPNTGQPVTVQGIVSQPGEPQLIPGTSR